MIHTLVENTAARFLDKVSLTLDGKTREVLVEVLIREDGDASAITIHDPFAAVIGNGKAYYQTWAHFSPIHRPLREHETGFSIGAYTFRLNTEIIVRNRQAVIRRWAEDATHSQDQTRINR